MEHVVPPPLNPRLSAMDINGVQSIVGYNMDDISTAGSEIDGCGCGIVWKLNGKEIPK